jgi:serine/threonine protein kinase
LNRAALILGVTGLVSAAGVYAAGGVGGRAAPSRSTLEEISKQVDENLSQVAGAVRRRAEALAQLPFLAALVSTDAATARDLKSDDMTLRPAFGETIEVGQLPRDGKPVSLLVLPEGSKTVAPLDRLGLQPSAADGALLLSYLVAVRPQERADELTGVAAVSLPVDLSQVGRRVDELGLRARLELPNGTVPIGSGAFASDGVVTAGRLDGEVGHPLRLTFQVPARPWILGPGPEAILVAAAFLGAAVALRSRRAPAPSPPETAPAGGRRYRLLRRLARGGMGEVWEAVAVGSVGFERKVAIKRVFPDHQGDAPYLRMFVDEARIASNLHHANIAAVLDFGVADGVPFQVMDYVDGIDLQRLATLAMERGEPLPAELAVYVCLQVAHALSYAHAAQDARGEPLHIVHRDVSPDNVLVSWAGDVKLSDFGIAFAEGRMEKTAQGVMKGKLGYMSPEQATAGTVDLRADIFSLGCVLHRLLTGESPLAGDTALANLLAGNEIVLGPAVPPDLAPIVAKAVRRSRFDRYETAGALAEALGVALAARMTRDPRRAMCEWIERVRPGLIPLTEVKPDAPSGGELVLASESGSMPFFERVTKP